MNRNEYAQLIYNKLSDEKKRLKKDFRTKNQIQSFALDDVLPEDLANEIYKAFPDPEDMAERKSLRENKKIAAQLNKYNPILEEITYAFQDQKIINLIGEITGLEELIPDDNLYNGGISLMSQGNFLRPHLDNSHDMHRKYYRVLNLLYYITPDWKLEYGGNLELWDSGTKKEPRTITSKFNRLAVMITNKTSLHSVSEVTHNGARCCVSNYYFSPISVESKDYFHVTSFRGRNNEPFQDLILQTDSKLRNFIRLFAKKGVFKVWHKYDKDK